MNRPPRLNHGTLTDTLACRAAVSPAAGRDVTGGTGDADSLPLLPVEPTAAPKEADGPLSDGENGSPE